MRILHVTDVFLPRVGGIELHVHDMAARQRDSGHQVEVLTLTHGGGANDALYAAAVHRPPYRAWPGKIPYLVRQRSLGRISEFDVVHAHISTISPLAFASLRASQPVPTVVTVHSLWRRYRWFYHAFDMTFGWAGYPVVWSAVSRAAADAIVRSTFRSLQVPVVPNGFDFDDWPLTERDIRPGELRLASVMRLTGRKRPMALLRMLRALRMRLPQHVALSATIIGDGPRRDDMDQFLQRHRMTEWVDMPGQVPRTAVARSLAHATHYVAPAHLESFGIAALEARATGLPVIGLQASGLSDFIEHGRTGFLVRDDAEMVDALAELAERPLPVDPLMDRSRLQAMSWDHVIARTHELYEQAGAVVTRRAGRMVS